MEENHSNSSKHVGNWTGGGMEMQMYAVLWSGVLLLVLVILGILPNFALLVAMRCKRQTQAWSYGLMYSMCVCNIVFCVIWIPLNFGIVLTNYYGEGVHYGVCYMHIALFHFCVALLCCSTIFIGVQRLSALWSQYHGQKTNNLLVCVSVVFTWLVGCLCAVYVSFDYSNTYSFASCNRNTEVIGFTPNYELLANHRAETVLCLIYIAALASTTFIFLLFGMLRRRSLNNRSKPDKKRNCNYQGMPNVDGCPEDDKVLMASTISQTSPTKSSIRENSDNKKSSSKLSICKKVCLQEPKAEDIHAISDVDDDDDDDKFDQKMRMKLSKSKRSSGRRHTVANIGSSETGLKGRRGSMDDQQSGSSPFNYQYIRKWSVDIVALQDQLENPKIHAVHLQELVDFRDKKKKESIEKAELQNKEEKNEAEEKKKDEPAQSSKNTELKMIQEQISEEGEGPNSKETEENTANNKVNLMPNKSDVKTVTPITEKTSDTIAICSKEDPSSSSIEVPAITIKTSSHGNNQDEVIIQTFEPPNEEIARDDKEYSTRVLRRLVTVWKSVLHMVILTCCLLPLCIFLVLVDDCVSKRNVLLTLLLIQCPLHPLLLAWTDPVVQQALRRLKLKMTSLRCVCYCNIGKGKRCLGRPTEYC